MIKLNKKGFTLIELLAVIVILAVVLVVTIPSVISSMKKARQGAFQDAIATIELYVTSEYEKCMLGDTNLASYNTNFLSTSCAITATGATTDNATKAIITGAGYALTDITSVTVAISDGKARVSAATVGTTSGAKFYDVNVNSLR